MIRKIQDKTLLTWGYIESNPSYCDSYAESYADSGYYSESYTDAGTYYEYSEA